MHKHDALRAMHQVSSPSSRCECLFLGVHIFTVRAEPWVSLKSFVSVNKNFTITCSNLLGNPAYNKSSFYHVSGYGKSQWIKEDLIGIMP